MKLIVVVLVFWAWIVNIPIILHAYLSGIPLREAMLVPFAMTAILAPPFSVLCWYAGFLMGPKEKK